MSPQLYIVWNGIKTFTRRHHPILFITFIGLLLIAAVTFLYLILVITLGEPPTKTSSISPFDQKTVEKIKELHISSDTGTAPLVFPSPRSNPFVE